ncbi:MAG: hypothetical protein J0M12_12795, partial [Deltaproteobacteria bacterium]|nr:hypothetical protein [Deltaproteobacteria bacterium]
FLTGPDEVVSQILASVKLGSTEDPTQHTSRLVLLDGQGQVRGYYQGTDDQAFEFLERDLKTLQPAS